MNTYVQDETIPIYIFLNYGVNTLKFPINPENLKMDTDSASETENIEGIGEVSIPVSPKLAKLSINSFFWHDVNLLPSFMYVQWLKKWQQSKKEANLVVTRLNYSMQVTCERFSYDIRAGEEKDIYFELDLREYRPYGARRLNTADNKTLMQRYQQMLDTATLPVLIEIPKPVRSSALKTEVESPYTTKQNDTILTITKKITGTTKRWKELYNANKETLDDIIAGGDSVGEIPAGTKLIIPDEWLNT